MHLSVSDSLLEMCSGIYSLALTRNVLTVYTGSRDNTILVWSCAKGTHIETHSVEQFVLNSNLILV